MPKFYFNSSDGRGTFLDDVGAEASSAEHAHARAVAWSSELIRDLAESNPHDADLSVWVADERGEVVCSLLFKAARQPPDVLSRRA